jgi:peptide deformylase
MKTPIFPLILLSLSILSASCTKELKYTKEELYRIATKADPSVSFVLPKSITEGISCADYGEGCLSGHTVSVKNLELIAVEYMTEEQAKFAAIKYRGYYVRNWLLDDVTGEPILEKFVSEKLQAKKP